MHLDHPAKQKIILPRHCIFFVVKLSYIQLNLY
jgi:hypothetical protein